jgi:hypothetical protein
MKTLPRAPARSRRAAALLRAGAWVRAAWTLVGLFRAADRYFSDPFQLRRLEFGLWEALAQSLLAAYIWAAFTPAVVWIGRRCLPARARWAAQIGSLALASLVFPVMHCAVFQLAYPLLMGFPCVVAVQLAAVRQLLPLAFPTHFVTFWGIVGTTWMLRYATLSRERELRASQLETRLTSARLETLKMQLHPHFLFNTLNSILPLIGKDPERARQMVVRLGDLLRLSLRSEDTPLVTLEEEIAILEKYLSIEKARFRDRLEIEIEIEPAVAAANVPSFLLQPLVENAIKHGLAGRAGRGRISILARAERGQLAIRLRDNGSGPRDDRDETTGIGLRNTRRRLEALYPGAHLLDLAPAPEGGCDVRIRLPLTLAHIATRKAASAGSGDPVAISRAS